MLPTILIPFREQVEQGRGEQLKKFVSHIGRYHPDWTVLVIEQSDDGKKFNRGALLNVGTKYAEKMGASYVIYHDVDLIPLSPLAKYYKEFPEEPIHIGSAYKGKYANDTFIGQVLSISIKDIKKINGFPNNFWGWGGEDDAMYRRLKKHKLNIIKLPISTGFKVLEHTDTRKIPDAKNMTKWEDLKADTGKSGLQNIKWKLLEKQGEGKIIKFTVEIK
jgi:hypothetical protein